METWVIRKGYYDFEAVQLVKRTAQMVLFIDRRWDRKSETRQAKINFLDWEGSKEEAIELASELNAAATEFQRKRREASERYEARKAEILTRASAAIGG